ncbi:hypothetical protein RIF29_18658 [Crotalaria pallida]|uniref:Uncharacterized protein n=1 Tax=Crotalaria pallida TaxID=3830 RepID=A0AAN9I5R0_CROPI
MLMDHFLLHFSSINRVKFHNFDAIPLFNDHLLRGHTLTVFKSINRGYPRTKDRSRSDVPPGTKDDDVPPAVSPETEHWTKLSKQMMELVEGYEGPVFSVTEDSKDDGEGLSCGGGSPHSSSRRRIDDKGGYVVRMPADADGSG